MFHSQFCEEPTKTSIVKDSFRTFISVMFDFSAMNISMTTQWFSACLFLHEFIKGNWYLSSTIPTLKGLGL